MATIYKVPFGNIQRWVFEGCLLKIKIPFDCINNKTEVDQWVEKDQV